MMLGILYKDILSSWKYILLTWAIVLAYSVIPAIEAADMKGILSMVLLFSYIGLMSRFFQAEEKNNTMVLLKTLPVSYSVMVASKYLLCFLMSVSSLLLSLLVSLVIPSIGISAWSGISGLFIVYLFVLGTSYSAVGIFVYLRFGYSYLNIANILIFLMTIPLAYYVVPFFSLPQTLLHVLVLGGLILSCIVLFLLSVKAVKTRNFLKD